MPSGIERIPFEHNKSIINWFFINKLNNLLKQEKKNNSLASHAWFWPSDTNTDRHTYKFFFDWLLFVIFAFANFKLSPEFPKKKLYYLKPNLFNEWCYLKRKFIYLLNFFTLLFFLLLRLFIWNRLNEFMIFFFYEIIIILSYFMRANCLLLYTLFLLLSISLETT